MIRTIESRKKQQKPAIRFVTFYSDKVNFNSQSIYYILNVTYNTSKLVPYSFHSKMFTTSLFKCTNQNANYSEKLSTNSDVNTFRTSKGRPKFCIDLGADWLLILDEVGGKSPGLLALQIVCQFHGSQNARNSDLII